MWIGILTLFHKNYNWGGVLQGYALKTYLENTFPNASVDILEYYSGTNVVYPNKIQQAMQYSPGEIISKLKEKVKGKSNSAIKADLHQRMERFEQFMVECSTNKKVYSDGNLLSAAKEYDCLICGSDQIWNPNVARPGYFLKMVDNECAKISYAASIARNDLSEHERKIILPLIAHFDFISVREKTAQKFLSKYLPPNIKIEEVLDPAFLLSANEWDKLIQEPYVKEEKYALAFFFSESLEYRKEIDQYCKKKKIKLKVIPFAKGNFIFSDTMGPGDPLCNVGPKEFLSLIKDAEFVFTDSFHGAVFSIIYKKQFFIFERDKNTKTSKNSRLHDLLEKFELSDRLIHGDRTIESLMNKRIDFDNVHLLLLKYRQKSEGYLKNALQVVKVKEANISTVEDMEIEKCCGCSLCADLCPQKCISMKVNKEGFLYPNIDRNRCIKCGLCVDACAGRKPGRCTAVSETYIGYNQDKNIRKESSSGGLFYELGKGILNQNGIVYGAAFNDKFEVEHVRINRIADLKKILKSKYVQSNIECTYENIQKDLENGKKVLFSGTPCQVGAIYNFACRKRLLENLYLVDFICHGVPSPGIWQSYLKHIQGDVAQIEKIEFRDKSGGWHDYSFYVKCKGGNSWRESHEMNAYMRTFLSDNNLRPSCYDCAYKGTAYVADITVGDAWKIEKDKSEWADDQGTSVFIIRSHKGQELLDGLSSNFTFCKTDYAKWARWNPSLIFSTEMPSSRVEFFNDFIEYDNPVFWNKYSKVPERAAFCHVGKRILKKIGVEKVVRKIL